MFDELEENKLREQKPADYSGLIIFACTLPVLLFFTLMGKTDMGLNVGMSLGIALLVIRIYWKLFRTRLWFWIVVFLLWIVHVS